MVTGALRGGGGRGWVGQRVSAVREETHKKGALQGPAFARRGGSRQLFCEAHSGQALLLEH